MSKMSVTEVARILEVTPSTVVRWINQGYLKAEKDPNGRGRYGGSYLIEDADLRAFVMSDNYTGHPEDILNFRAFNRVPSLEECYPINLLIACLDIPIDSEEVAPDVWDYDIRHFKQLISTLMDREQRVLEMRYQFGMSLDEVAKAFGLTRERVRQIQKKAERKLRYCSASSGIRVVNHETFDALKQENTKLKARISGLEHNLDVYRARLEELNVELEKPEENRGCKAESFNKVKIEELDWSVRAYNCLKRAGFNTLGDILYFDQNQGNVEEPFRCQSWWHIRNFGRKSLMEVAKSVFNYCGYRLQDWKEGNGYVGLIPLAPNDELCSVPIYRGE